MFAQSTVHGKNHRHDVVANLQDALKTPNKNNIFPSTVFFKGLYNTFHKVQPLVLQVVIEAVAV